MPMRLVPLLAALPLAMAAGPAVAFTSMPFGAIHGAITREALAGVLPDRAVAQVIEANWRADFDEMTIALWPGKALFVPNGRYEPAHHFDRGGNERHAAAFERGAAYVAQMRREAAASLSAGREEAGLRALGRGLHALQDFCSHSNLVDLGEDERQAVAAILAGASRPVPEALRLTGYDPETGRDPHGDAYGHDAFSKDGPDRTPEARARIGERTKHELAVEAAVALSRAFVAGVPMTDR